MGVPEGGDGELTLLHLQLQGIDFINVTRDTGGEDKEEEEERS